MNNEIQIFNCNTEECHNYVRSHGNSTFRSTPTIIDIQSTNHGDEPCKGFKVINNIPYAYRVDSRPLILLQENGFEKITPSKPTILCNTNSMIHSYNGVAVATSKDLLIKAVVNNEIGDMCFDAELYLYKIDTAGMKLVQFPSKEIDITECVAVRIPYDRIISATCIRDVDEGRERAGGEISEHKPESWIKTPNPGYWKNNQVLNMEKLSTTQSSNLKEIECKPANQPLSHYKNYGRSHSL